MTISSKEASKVWKTKDEEALRKAREILSAGKVMVTIFWDVHGILLIKFLPDSIDPVTGQKYTVSADQYFNALVKLHKAIWCKRSGLLTRCLILLHDIARHHSAHLTQTLLRNLKWETFPHPAYSPNLTPSEFHTFPGLKKEV